MGTRPTVALVDLNAIRHNYTQIRGVVSPQTKIMPIVKANAYGHGDVEASKIFEKLGCESLGVAFAEEGVKIRSAGVKTPIVVLGGVYPSQIQDSFDYDLTPVVFDVDTATLLNKFAKKRAVKKNVQIKIDSGMGRLGVLPRHIVSFFQEFKGFENLEVDGLMSHFSEADNPDKDYSKKQIDTFLKAITIIQGLGYNPRYIHMANSAAIIDHVDAHFNLVRPGIMLYGVYPSQRYRDKIKLKPAMQIKTQILYLKKVSPGTPISYAKTFVTTRESLIGILPIGYGDGLPFRLSGSGEALVRGRRVPMVGRICMDLTMIDCTSVEGVSAGDEVIIVGRGDEETITVEDVAQKTGTIPYEILTGITQRVERLAV